MPTERWGGPVFATPLPPLPLPLRLPYPPATAPTASAVSPKKNRDAGTNAPASHKLLRIQRKARLAPPAAPGDEAEGEQPEEGGVDAGLGDGREGEVVDAKALTSIFVAHDNLEDVGAFAQSAQC